MKDKPTVKQFDFAHLRVDEKLHGAKLASFTRRFLAYSLDWIIIVVCTQFLFLLIPLFLLLLLFKRKLHFTLVKTRRIIKRSVFLAGNKLEENTLIAPALKRRFTRGMVVYLYILLYLPIVATILYFSLIVMEHFSPQTYQHVTADLTSVFHLMSRPVVDLTNAFDLISRFFGAFVYFSVFTWKWHGQTPAKKLFRISVVKIDGSPLSFYNSLERTSGYTASASIIFLGFLQYFWDTNAQTTHDKIAETVVIELYARAAEFGTNTHDVTMGQKN